MSTPEDRCAAWRHIADSDGIQTGTVADLRMPGGRIIYRAIWDWVEIEGKRLICWSSPSNQVIGAANPVEWRLIMPGSGGDPLWFPLWALD